MRVVLAISRSEFLSFDWLRTNGKWQLLVVVAGYLIGVMWTNLVFVTYPAVRKVVRQLDEEWTLVELRLGQESPTADRFKELLEAGYRVLRSRWRRDDVRKPDRLRVNASLSKVIGARRYLNSVVRLRRWQDPEDHVAIARLEASRLRTQSPTWRNRQRADEAIAIATQIDQIIAALTYLKASAIPSSADNEDVKNRRSELRIALNESLELIQANDDDELDRNAEAQTRTLWMVLAGLGFVMLAGIFGPRTPLLFGAIGGFLAPVMLVRRTKLDPSDYRTSWEVLMLGPVAGALAASGGLLLIEMLSAPDFNVLGPSLGANAWDHATTTTAKGLALLLGYSATLFTFLAGRAEKAVADTSKAEDEKKTDKPAAPQAPAPPATPDAGSSNAGESTPPAGPALPFQLTVGERIEDLSAPASTADASLPNGWSMTDLVGDDLAPEGSEVDCDGDVGGGDTEGDGSE